MDALATLTINTFVTRAQECRVEHPGSHFVWVFKTDPLVIFVFIRHNDTLVKKRCHRCIHLCGNL